MVRRMTQLGVGIAAFGVGVAMIVRARLGLGPWDVLHQGIAAHTGLRIGTVNGLVAVVVLLLWVPLRQRPGTGTVANALLIGPVLGGTAGVGTVAYALGIGPLVHLLLPPLTVREGARAENVGPVAEHDR